MLPGFPSCAYANQQGAQKDAVLSGAVYQAVRRVEAKVGDKAQGPENRPKAPGHQAYQSRAELMRIMRATVAFL